MPQTSDDSLFLHFVVVNSLFSIHCRQEMLLDEDHGWSNEGVH